MCNLTDGIKVISIDEYLLEYTEKRNFAAMSLRSNGINSRKKW